MFDSLTFNAQFSLQSMNWSIENNCDLLVRWSDDDSIWFAGVRASIQYTHFSQMRLCRRCRYHLIFSNFNKNWPIFTWRCAQIDQMVQIREKLDKRYDVYRIWKGKTNALWHTNTRRVEAQWKPFFGKNTGKYAKRTLSFD